MKNYFQINYEKLTGSALLIVLYMRSHLAVVFFTR